MNKLKLFIVISFVAVLTATPVFAQEDPSPTPTGNNIRDKVQEKVNASLDKPFAYIGTVTDISGVNIQIGKFSLNNGKTNSKTTYISIN